MKSARALRSTETGSALCATKSAAALLHHYLEREHFFKGEPFSRGIGIGQSLRRMNEN